ncbi:MAG: type II toxin-antitoxin system VapC family toxin [Candidatus Heimdallarchaeota archaeon]
MKRILLDTNVFNNMPFLQWIAQHAKAKRVVPFINSIIYLELGFLYWVRGNWDLFERVMTRLGIQFLSVSITDAKNSIEAAYTFKDTPEGAAIHFRDCLIGGTAISNNLMIVTRNTKHYAFLPLEMISTPEDIMTN